MRNTRRQRETRGWRCDGQRWEVEAAPQTLQALRAVCWGGRAGQGGLCWAVRAPSPAAVRALQLGLPRSASVPALSEQPQCAGAQCSLHSPADWRSRRSPCLLLSGSQVRERSQLLFPSADQRSLPAWRAAPGHPSGGSHPATQTHSDFKLLWQLPERNVLLKGSRDHPHSSSCRHRCSADTS